MKAYELLKTAEAIDDHRLSVVFEDGTAGVFDCAPYFGMGYYRRLGNPAFFKTVKVSCGWLSWPDEIDIGADDVWREVRRSEARGTRRESGRRSL